MSQSEPELELVLVWAMSENGVIGVDGGLPWSLPDDLARFKRLTVGHPVVMGRRTWDSLWIKPLPKRLNVVVTRNGDFRAEGAEVVSSVAEALARCESGPVFCIGGADMFDQLMADADRMEVTVVHTEMDGDVYMPYIDWESWALVYEELHPADDRHEFAFTFRTFERVT